MHIRDTSVTSNSEFAHTICTLHTAYARRKPPSRDQHVTESMYRRSARLLLTNLLLATLVFATGAASAQPAPAPDDLLHRWVSSQVPAARLARQISFAEETQRVLDGPFGKRRLQMRSRLTGHPGTNDWKRDILTASANGRILTPSEFDRMERLSDHMAGARVDRLLQELLFPAGALARMRSVGPATRETIRGVAAWRFDAAAPETARLSVQRMTIWMSAEKATLLRSRTILNRPSDRSTLTVVTDYDRDRGLDVPVRRHVEGTIQARRRLRTFTLVLRVDSHYSDYRINRK